MDYERLLALLALPFLRGFWVLVGYLTGNAFPQPLTEAEEALYLAGHLSGDSGSRQTLIERNLRLVAHIVKNIGTKTTNPVVRPNPVLLTLPGSYQLLGARSPSCQSGVSRSPIPYSPTDDA